jgi:ubiquinone/menaquinone biosynthesis C-methylase UbiE
MTRAFRIGDLEAAVAPETELLPLDPDRIAEGHWYDGILRFPLGGMSRGLLANAFYFSVPPWAQEYLDHCHRDADFVALWRAAMGSWDDKVVVDVGCGPGNLLASLGGRPRQIIGIDVAEASLQLARRIGYQPILADAHRLPLRTGCADIVTLNASLHHCDDMPQVLREAGRLVRPGGLLITDHDHQLSAGNFRGLAALLWQARLPLNRLKRVGPHGDALQQQCMLAGEVHADEPGRGVTRELYHQALEPLGFQVCLVPHNHNAGAAALAGVRGRAKRSWRWLQRLSGIDPDTADGALSLMCIATRDRGLTV